MELKRSCINGARLLVPMDHSKGGACVVANEANGLILHEIDYFAPIFLRLSIGLLCSLIMCMIFWLPSLWGIH